MQTETVDIKTLPARRPTTGDADRATLDELVRGIVKLPAGQAIIIREDGASGKGLSSKLGRAAKRVGLADVTVRGSGEDEKGVYAFIKRIDTEPVKAGK